MGLIVSDREDDLAYLIWVEHLTKKYHKDQNYRGKCGRKY